MFDLYLVTDPIAQPGIVEATRAALSAAPPGRVAVQLRHKGAPASELVALGHALRDVTRAHGVPLLVNDRADIAKIIGADGVHCPERALTPGDVRAVLGPDALVGVSCHDEDGLRAAERGGATFVTLGPFAATPDKKPPLARHRFAVITDLARVPILALGGVDASLVADAIRAGARGVAVIRAVYQASDPAAAVLALCRSLDSARVRAR